jgi:hypothetical protein
MRCCGSGVSPFVHAETSTFGTSVSRSTLAKLRLPHRTLHLSPIKGAFGSDERKYVEAEVRLHQGVGGKRL